MMQSGHAFMMLTKIHVHFLLTRYTEKTLHELPTSPWRVRCAIPRDEREPDAVPAAGHAPVRAARRPGIRRGLGRRAPLGRHGDHRLARGVHRRRGGTHET